MIYTDHLFFGLVLAGNFSTILTSSGRYLAGIFKSEDSPGWYFLENLDYWLVFLDQFGLLAGIFGPIWTIGRYF